MVTTIPFSSIPALSKASYPPLEITQSIALKFISTIPSHLKNEPSPKETIPSPKVILEILGEHPEF